MANKIDVEIGKRLRTFRMARGMSQSVLAEGLNITFQQVQKYEYGRKPHGSQLDRPQVIPTEVLAKLQQ